MLSDQWREAKRRWTSFSGPEIDLSIISRGNFRPTDLAIILACVLLVREEEKRKPPRVAYMYAKKGEE